MELRSKTVISKFYEALFSKIDSSEIENIYISFIYEIKSISKIKAIFSKQSSFYNRLISECLFWAFSALENEDIDLKKIDNPILIDELVVF